MQQLHREVSCRVINGGFTSYVLEVTILKPYDSLNTSDAAHANVQVERLQIEEDTLVIEVVEEDLGISALHDEWRPQSRKGIELHLLQHL
jgi:hypothetical protein